jgi:hypothetical protein
MSYGHRPYPPRGHGYYEHSGGYEDGYYPPAGRRDDGAYAVASIIRVIIGLITTVFVLHIVFVVLHANDGNGFVAFIYTLAKTLVLGLGDVFTPNDAVLGVVLNYGLAALVYLVVGELIIKAIRGADA